MNTILLLLSHMLVTAIAFSVTPKLQTSIRSQHSILWHAADDVEVLKLADDKMFMEGIKLGINIGSQLEPMNEQERLSLREDIKNIIDKEVAKGLEDLGRMRERYNRENEERNDSLERAMNMNGTRESEKLRIKVDAMVGKFLSATSESRQRTHHMNWVVEEKAKEAEKEKERKEKSKHERKTWNDTNDAWDDWDDWKKRD